MSKSIARRPEAELQLTRDVLSWLAADESWTDLDLRYRLRMRWSSRWNSINARLSYSASMRSSIVGVADPLLIAGPWRSGTTVLHELLVAATGLQTPRTWQCMNAAAFTLTPAPRVGVGTQRPMDRLEVRHDSPQEDEFALLTLGVHSAYRAFLMPHRIAELAHTLDQTYWLQHPAWLLAWEQFLNAVLHGDLAPQPLILKSPNHTFRLRSILERFPRTRIVWLIRNPAEVFHSNRKMWRAMFSRYALTNCAADDLDDFLGQALAAASDALIWCVDNMDHTQFAAVTHRDLVERPSAVVHALLERLRLPSRAHGSALEHELRRLGNARIDHYAEDPPVKVLAALRALEDVYGSVANNAELTALVG